jgi:hypothetical protein
LLTVKDLTPPDAPPDDLAPAPAVVDVSVQDDAARTTT